MTDARDPKTLTCEEVDASLDDDLLTGPISLAEQELREAGLDPEEVGKKGAAFVDNLLHKPDYGSTPPGSESAKRQGCACPDIDNHYGRGRYDDGSKYGWFVYEGCPLHWKQ